MKKLHAVSAALTGAFLLGFTSTVQAQTTRYWDTDGTNPGFGVGGPYDWMLDNLWNTSSTGGNGTIGGWTDGDIAIFNGNGVSTISVTTNLADATDIVICTNVFITDLPPSSNTTTTVNFTGPGQLTVLQTYMGVGWQDSTATSTGILNMSGGYIYAQPTTCVVGRIGCAGILNVSNGTLYCESLRMGNGGNSTVNVSGGTLQSWANPYIGYGSPSVLTVSGTGTVIFNAVSTCGALGATAVVNLNGGRMYSRVWSKTYTSDPATTLTINFNGGIWTQGTSSANPSIPYNVDYCNVQAGGAIFDTTNLGCYLQNNLLDGGTGGGLTKLGTGSLLLFGQNTYTGGTTISNGTLYLENWTYNGLDSTIASSAFINILPGATMNVTTRSDGTLQLAANQILEGGGSVAGALNANGIVAPGGGTNGAPGTLTVAGNAMLNGTAWMKLNGTSNDELVSTHALTFGGTLMVTASGPALTVGQSFTLFQAPGGLGGSFANIVLPAAYTWNISQLATSYSITVTGVIQPVISIASDSQLASQGILTFSASNGIASQPYTLWGTTNVALPFSKWVSVTNGNLDGNGNLNVSVNVGKAAPQQFFLLQQP